MPTFYVAPSSGSDSNTGLTVGTPFATVAKGVQMAVAGDTVLLRAGTHTGSGATIDSQGHTVNSGTSFANAVTIAGYPGETAIIQPPSNVSAVRLTTGNPHHLIIRDLTMDMVNSGSGTTAEGIFMYLAHHIRFQRVDLKNGFGFGVHTGDDTPFCEFLQCKIHNFGSAASAPGDGHGLYITSSDNLFDGCEVYSNGGYGFHIYNNRVPHVDPCRNVVRNCRIHDNGLTLLATAYGVVVTWGDSNKVYNNLIYDNQAGAQLYTESTNTLFANNTVYSNTNEGIALQYYGAGIIVRNNIVYSNGSGIVDNGGSSSPTISNNLTTNPSFVNAGAGNFALQTGSAAINAGVTVSSVTVDIAGTARPQGGTYDIGAYEAVVFTGGSNVIDPGDDVAAIHAAGAAGDEYVFNDGYHRITSAIVPRQGDIFRGANHRAAVISGAKQLSSGGFSNNGNGTWTIGGQTQTETLDGATACTSGDMCRSPMDLFIDNVIQLRVSGAVGAGQWSFNDGANTITIGTDPSGKVVETSVCSKAFSSGATGVTIGGSTSTGLVIEKFANNFQTGMLEPGANWVISDNIIRQAHATAVRLNGGIRLLRNLITRNGQMGIGGGNGGSGNFILVQGNEISYNNAQNLYAVGYEAGGSKIAGANGYNYNGNWAHHNVGPGLWEDVNNWNGIVEYNICEDNTWAGIWHEISQNVIIRYNTVRRCGANPQAGTWDAYKAGILISASHNVEVHNNIIEECPHGVSCVQQTRPEYQPPPGHPNHNPALWTGAYGVDFSGSPPVPYYLGDHRLFSINVHDNVIAHSVGNGGNGIWVDNGDANITNGTNNNQFQGNVYYLGGGSGSFEWEGGRTFTGWQGKGQDISGQSLPFDDYVPLEPYEPVDPENPEGPENPENPGGAIPIGSLVFTGFGDSGTMRFYSPTGTKLEQPSSAPVPGEGVDGIVALKPSGRYGVIGANAPNFPETGIGTFNADLTVRAEAAVGGAGRGAARDDADHFYGGGSDGLAGQIVRYDDDAADRTVYGPIPPFGTGTDHDVVGVAVNGAGTIAYFVVNTNDTAEPTQTVVYAWDLEGDSSLGSFASEGAGWKVLNGNAMLALSNGEVLVGWRKASTDGYVKHYNAAGSVLHTYALAGTEAAPVALSHGINDTSFWVGYYNDDVDTSSGITIAEIEISSGSVLHSFTPDDGDFEFDCAFAIVRVAIEEVIEHFPPIPPPNNPECCSTPGNPENPNPGHVPTPVSPAWIPVCAGAGEVDELADLLDPEDWYALS